MNTFMQKLEDKNIVSLIKDYSSFILLMLTILGGAKQFAILFYYSPTLTQYFSVSQVLIDGIALIIKFCIFFVGVVIYLYLFNNYGRLRHIIILFVSLTIPVFLINLSGISNFGFVIINLYIIILLGMLFIATYIHLENEIPFDIESEYNKKIISIFFFICCVTYIFFSEKKPIDIINIKTNTSIIRKELPNAELVYFNDQYLFYGLRTKETIPDYKKLYDSLKNTPNFDHRVLVPPRINGPNYSAFYIQKHDVLFEK